MVYCARSGPPKRRCWGAPHLRVPGRTCARGASTFDGPPSGDSPETSRCDHPPPIKFGFDPTELAELERKVLATDVGNASVLVISDDAVIRAGLQGVLTEAGAVCWAEPVCDLHPALITAWDYILVWVRSHRGSDRLAAISHVAALSSQVTTVVPVIAVHGAALPAVTRLRLAEAGFRYLVPHSWLSQHLAGLAQLLGRADIPQEFHLATPLALRQALGLQLSGELEPLISRAADLPETVWMDQTQKASAPPRSAVNELRAMALRSGGLPPPDFAKYATSTRRAPELPEWPRVRELLRESLGYVYTTRPWSAQVAPADARI